MKIELLDPRTLQPYTANPRKIDAAVAAVAESIRRFGFRKPIVTDTALVIIAGHVRHQAALRLNLPLVPVHIAAELSEAQARAYRLADNQTGQLTEWDNEKLIDELLDLDRVGELDASGFTKAELDTLLEGRAPADDAAWDEAFGALPDCSPTHNRQTFTLTKEQKADVLAAAQAALRSHDLRNPDNTDAIANAIAHIAEVYLER